MGEANGAVRELDGSMSRARLIPSYRLAITVLCFFMLFELYILRVNISMAMVCMVRSRTVSNCTKSDNVNISDSAAAVAVAKGCFGSPDRWNQLNGTAGENLTDVTGNDAALGGKTDQGEFDWNKSLQGFILSSYYFGYITTQAVGGWLGGRFGGKHVAGTGLLISVITTVILPSAARLSPYFVIVLRVILGAASGVLLVNVQCLMGRWAPPLERTILSAFAFNGMTVGVIAALLVSSQFCQLPVDNGWPFAFYISGGSGFVVWIVWNFVVYDSPADHPRISRNEVEYIRRCCGLAKPTQQQKRRPFPWLKAVRSHAVIAIAVTHTASNWQTYINVTTFPMYVKDVLLFDVRKNGIFVMLPHALALVMNTPVSQLADVLRKRRLLSTVVARKVFQGIACFSSCLLVIGLSFVDRTTRYVAVAVNIAMMTTQIVCNRCGYLVNSQDIAPKYSGEVFGISNTLSTLSGIVAPAVCGLLTPNGTADEWKTVFYITGAFQCVGGIVFSIFAEGEVQSWAKDEVENNGAVACGTEMSTAASLAVSAEDERSAGERDKR